MTEAPEPEAAQLAAFAVWLGRPDVVRKLGALMPLCGDARSAVECRVRLAGRNR